MVKEVSWEVKMEEDKGGGGVGQEGGQRGGRGGGKGGRGGGQ